MPIDASIFQQAQPAPVNIPSPLETAKQAMSLSQLGMQQMQMARQMRTQSAVQEAYAGSTDPDTGQLDQQRFLSQLHKTAPQAAMEYEGQFAQLNKQQAEAKAAQLDNIQKTVSITGPAFDYMAGLPDDQRAKVWPQMMDRLKAQGVDTSRMDHDYDPQLFSQYYGTWQKSKPGLESIAQQANIAKTNVETATMPGAKAAALKADIFGSRAPTTTLTDQYGSEPATKTARNSAVAMGQMLHNYDNRSPQGDVSLMITAYKIKNPDKPDVNSLDELQKAEGVPEQWKNAISHRVNGLFSQGVVDDLMRDAYSAYGPNVQGARDTQQKYQDYARSIGVPAPNTAEPSMDKTYTKASALMNKLGPYVPETERSGSILGTIKNAASKLTGGTEQAASAGSNGAPKSPYRAAGSSVSADQVAQYATKHGMKLKDAQAFLKGQGYAVGN